MPSALRQVPWMPAAWSPKTASLPLERTYARESAFVAELIREEATRTRLRALRVLRWPAGVGAGEGREVESAAVVGADQTGSDFAHLLVTAGIPVRLKDLNPYVVRDGVARVLRRLAWENTQGLISDSQLTRRSRRIEGVTGFGGFGTVDLLVEVAAGRGASTADRLRNLESHVRSDCVLSFHDWTVSPTEAQARLRSPDRVVGLVPAFPADRFPLLEIVTGALTSATATATASRLAYRMGLTPVVVGDRTPTPGARLLGIYLAEASRVLAEGATVTQVDAAMVAFGFAAGPFHRADAIGVPRVRQLLQQLTDTLGERMQPSPLLCRVADGAQTFYRYRRNRPLRPNPQLPAGLSPGGHTVTGMIQRRLLLILINEAARILENGAIEDPGALDVIAITGLGFPAARGGLLGWADTHGIPELVATLSRVASRQGDRYRPTDLLLEMADAGKCFLKDGHTRSGHEPVPTL
jgi:3-hydroxyacyl-CoA dehydrogenase/enoyl-CoA hydratase/3-hydroxybutyryl-CoA epimerase